MALPNTAALPVARNLVDGDTESFAIPTGLGDISTGTAVAYATDVDTGTATSLTCSGLDTSGNVTVDFSGILPGTNTEIKRYTLEIEVTVGSTILTSPSVEGTGAIYVVRPDRGSAA